MRLYEITEFSINKIKKECKPFLEMIKYDKDLVPYRGSRKEITEPTYIPIRTDRSPMDIPQPIHDIFNYTLKNLGFKARRDNSIFVTGSRSFAASYGRIYHVIPVGEFNFTWSPEIEDMIANYRDFVRKGFMTQIYPNNMEQNGENINKRISDAPIPSQDRWINLRGYHIEDRGLEKEFKRLFKSTDWKQAMDSDHEIYLQAEGAYWIPDEIFKELELASL